MQDSRDYVYGRQHVAERLRHPGFPELADEALSYPIQSMKIRSTPNARGKMSTRGRGQKRPVLDSGRDLGPSFCPSRANPLPRIRPLFPAASTVGTTARSGAGA